MLIVASMGVIAFWGISQSVTVAAVITVLEILGLVFVAGWGFFVSDKLGVEAIEIISPVSRAQWIGIGSASLLAFFAFVGFEDMANVAEEVKVPKRTMPRAIILTLIVATALYLATTTAVLLVVPLDQLSASTAPLLLVFEGADETVQFGFGVLAIVATVNGVLIQTIMASRVIFGLADRNHLPAVFAKVSQTTRTPSVATLSVVLVILILGQALPIEALAERTSQIVLMIFIVVNLSLVRLKRQTKPPADCFNVPLAVPILGILTSLGLLVMSVF
jgi:amino acid transporter